MFAGRFATSRSPGPGSRQRRPNARTPRASVGHRRRGSGQGAGRPVGAQLLKAHRRLRALALAASPAPPTGMPYARDKRKENPMHTHSVLPNPPVTPRRTHHADRWGLGLLGLDLLQHEAAHQALLPYYIPHVEKFSDFFGHAGAHPPLPPGYDSSLNWEERLHIALDAEQGLEYLHESCTPSIVHRDVKTPNILLDKNLVPKISDFGLSRAFNAAHTYISIVAAGTLGYFDPEYHATFQLTLKTDVYSFGIVLLEIVTGQPPVFMDPQAIHLPNWVRQKIAKGSINDVVEKKLLDQYDSTHLQTVICLAINCLENASTHRPSMTEVVSVLKACLPAVSSEKRSVTSNPRKKNVTDAAFPRRFQFWSFNNKLRG